MQRASFIVVVLTAALSVGCGDTVAGPGSGPPITHIRLIPFAAWLHPGDTLRLGALTFDADGRRIEREVRFAWTSTRPEVASVDSTGLVTAVGIGETELQAVAEGERATALIHVRPEPIAPDGFTLIAAGDEFTCGIAPVGVVFCWGRNAQGQLGNGRTGDGAVPIAVSGLAGVRTMAAGMRHACAIDAEGRPWCWGWNSVRQVGPWFEDKIAAVPEPAPVAGRFRGIAAGSGHTCALRDDGGVFCWGANPLGQLGGDTVGTDGVVTVTGLPPLIGLVAGHAHTCGLDATGIAWCWGWNAAGQLGAPGSVCPDGNPCSFVPIRVATSVRFTKLAAGSEFTCGLDAAGAAFCWGANENGQLGGVPGGTSAVPVRVPAVPAFTDLRAGARHACGRSADGLLFCWGENRLGQLGDGSGDVRAMPVVAELAPVPAIRFAAGGAHSCATSEAGIAICWGANASGQLGLNPAS